MKSYTDIEQSKKLAEILSFESADMIYMPIMDIDSMSNSGFFDIPECYPFNEFKNSNAKPLPCWSLAALLTILSFPNLFENDGWNLYTTIDEKLFSINNANNPVDACVDMIEKLHEQKLL